MAGILLTLSEGSHSGEGGKVEYFCMIYCPGFMSMLAGGLDTDAWCTTFYVYDCHVCIIILCNLKLSVLGSFSLCVCPLCPRVLKWRYSTPTLPFKFSTAGLRIPGENVIDDIPFLYKFWLQKNLFD